MLIKLTDIEIQQAKEVARQRNESQRQAGRPDGLVKGSSIDRDLEGALSELAVSKALQLPWDGKFLPIQIWDVWKHEGNDVGKLEIRSTTLENGSLILHPSDKDHSPYLLVLSHKRPEYLLAGWVWGKEGKASRYWRDNVPRPCFMVKQGNLRPMSELLTELEKLNETK